MPNKILISHLVVVEDLAGDPAQGGLASGGVGLEAAVVQDADHAIDALAELLGRGAGGGLPRQGQAEGEAYGDEHERTQSPDHAAAPCRCWSPVVGLREGMASRVPSGSPGQITDLLDLTIPGR